MFATCLFQGFSVYSHCTDMTSMKVAPGADAQQQDEQLLLTRNLLFSVVQNIAVSDTTLTREEGVKLVSTARVALGEAVDLAVEIKQDLRGEVDAALDSVKTIIDGFVDGDSKVAMDKMLDFFRRLVVETLKPGTINKSIIMITFIIAYALIRHYVKRYINEDINIMEFIKRMGSLLYRLFVELGVLDWIVKIGGWKMLLKLLTSNALYSHICSSTYLYRR